MFRVDRFVVNLQSKELFYVLLELLRCLLLDSLDLPDGLFDLQAHEDSVEGVVVAVVQARKLVHPLLASMKPYRVRAAAAPRRLVSQRVLLLLLGVARAVTVEIDDC